MGYIFDTMLEFFQAEDWKFEQLEGQPILRMGINGKNGKWACYAQAREEQEQFVFYSVSPMNAPEDRRLATAELLTRINYGLVVGNFEMDMRDGEIRYKTSVDVENDRISLPLIKNLVFINLQMMDRSLPALMSCMYGGLSPQQAAEQMEGQGGLPS